MNWEQLVSCTRLSDDSDPKTTTFKHDFDCLAFSTPFRRLQDKTQVFSLPRKRLVHNRLTHSLEVASIGMTLGNSAIPECPDAGQIVASACLAHDLGNPPFGHLGEFIIRSFFKRQFEKNNLTGRLMDKLQKEDLSISVIDAQEKVSRFKSDVESFDGNANTFRLLTHTFEGRLSGGFGLSYATIASTVKYPWNSQNTVKGKFGFFFSEESIFRKVFNHLGLVSSSAGEEPIKYKRHPFSFLVEAADDICYIVMDTEDAHKFGILSYMEVIELFYMFVDKKDYQKEMDQLEDDKNEAIAFLREKVIQLLVNECIDAFKKRVDKYEGSPLVETITHSVAFAYCKQLAYDRIYFHPLVRDVKPSGDQILMTILEKMTEAALHKKEKNDDCSFKELRELVPKQYGVDSDSVSVIDRLRGVVDFISGMTDIYALEFYKKLEGESVPQI